MSVSTRRPRMPGTRQESNSLQDSARQEGALVQRWDERAVRNFSELFPKKKPHRMTEKFEIGCQTLRTGLVFEVPPPPASVTHPQTEIGRTSHRSSTQGSLKF